MKKGISPQNTLTAIRGTKKVVFVEEGSFARKHRQ
jgi:hypothetical protein